MTLCLNRRIAYQLGLNRPPVRPLPSDEMAARLELVSGKHTGTTISVKLSLRSYAPPE